MKERPILFSGAMVRALLDGRKTQTRRAIKPPRKRDTFMLLDRGNGWWPYQSDDGESALCSDGNEHPYASPYGQPGDRLWVRESIKEDYVGSVSLSRYCADGQPVLYAGCNDPEYNGSVAHWDYSRPTRPSIHMPRWASRILLEVTAVRVERLQEISEADAKAEGLAEVSKDGQLFKFGIPDRDGLPGTNDLGWPWCRWKQDPRVAYHTLWESINGTGSWAANPWVWVVEFRVIEPSKGEA